MLPTCAASSGPARCVLSPSSSPLPTAPTAAPLPPTPSSMAWLIQTPRRRGSAHISLERRSSGLDRRPIAFQRPLRSPWLTPIQKPFTCQLGQFRPLSRALPARHAPVHAHIGVGRVVLENTKHTQGPVVMGIYCGAQKKGCVSIEVRSGHHRGRDGYRISPFGGPVTALFGTNQIRNQGLYHQGKNGSGKPRQDARRGRCHLLETGFWPLWMTLLPRNYAAQAQAQAQAQYEKKHSARRSTPRYPITMASTTEPPDPMPCALAAI